MERTTEAEVKAIMDNCTVDNSVITPFLTAASELVTQVFSGDSTLSDTLLEEIEKWLTAHMLACTICRTTSQEQVGDVSVKYTGYWSKNLESTSYGQMVLVLDITGKMANLGKKGASIHAVTSFD